MNIPLNFNFHILCGEERRLIVLRKTSGESIKHIVLKLLAYLVYFEDKLKIEAPALQHYKPDLVSFDSYKTWRAIRWVECGEIDLKKLIKICTHNRQTEIIIVKDSRPSALSLRERLIKKAVRISNVIYLVFNKEDLRIIESLLGRQNIIKFSKDLKQIFLELNSKSLNPKYELL